jgi:hypothetical protein
VPTSLKPGSKDPVYHEDPTKTPSEQPGAFNGGDKNTFDHMSDLGEFGARDPFDILAQREEEGPAEVRTRLHSCQKITYATLGNILSSLGVDLSATGDPPTAGQLYKGGAGALSKLLNRGSAGARIPHQRFEVRPVRVGEHRC